MKSILTSVKTMFAPEKSTAKDISVPAHKLRTPHIIDANAQNGYLAGQILVATPTIDSGCFQKAVIYLFAHNAEGAMGLILNQPLELINSSNLFEGMDIPKLGHTPRDIPVFFGGPVERARGFVLHSTDYVRDFTLARGTELAVTASSAILGDMFDGSGPKDASLIVGYAGWSAGQLEAEIEQNSWITVPPSAELAFNTPAELKWARAGQSLGIDMALMSTAVGHA